MADYKNKMQYERWIPQAPISTLYPFAYNFVLVNSIEQLKEILRTPFKTVAFDTETTGLNLDESFMVGYSFCFDGKTAYYVPVDHAEYFVPTKEQEISKEEYDMTDLTSLPDNVKYEIKDNKYYYQEGNMVKPGLGYEAVELFYKRMTLCDWVYMFNARFDMRVFEKYGFVQNNVPFDERYKKLHNGFDMSKIHFLDVQVLAFLADTNVPYPSLKKSEEYYLGWRGASFEETLGDASNFYYLRPDEAYIYAATDALGTFLLAQVLYQFYLEANDSKNAISHQGMSGYLDNAFLYPLMLMEEELIGIDTKLLQSYSEYYQDRITEVEETATRLTGSAFNLGSPKQKSERLKLLGIVTRELDGSPALNKRGELKADKKHLEMAMDFESTTEEQKTFMDCLLKYATLNKQKGTYTDNFIEMCKKSPYGDRLRFSYKTMVVPSGRLAAGGDKKNSYYADSNIQNITKPKIGDVYYIHKDTLPSLGLDISMYDNPREEYEYNGEHTYKILDWIFKETPWDIPYNEENPNHWVIEGFKQNLNIRSAFTPSDDCLWISCDYSAQELRLPALISKEPLWTKIFAEGGDLHAEMAKQMWGVENYDKQKRKMAKKINFGILYGMTAKNFAEDFKISMEEAEDTVKRYKETAPKLFDWVHRNEQRFIDTGVGYTLYGRPRRLGWYLNYKRHGDRGLYNFGIRSCTNTVIQGSGADCLKMGFMNIYKQFFLPEHRETNRKYVRFLNTVHDEINYAVKKDYVYKIVPKIIECMRLWQDDWAFPMQVGLDIGNRWGQTVAFDYDGRPYVKIEEQGYIEGEKRYRYISYDELSFEQGNQQGIIGKKRYVEDPNGDYVANKKYLNIISPAGDACDPQKLIHPEPKETDGSGMNTLREEGLYNKPSDYSRGQNNISYEESFTYSLEEQFDELEDFE